VFYNKDKRTKLVIWDKPVGEVTMYSLRISYNDGSSAQIIQKPVDKATVDKPFYGETSVHLKSFTNELIKSD